MEPLEFVAAVLPPPGNGRYCVVELSRKKEHVYVHTLEEAQPVIDRWKKAGEDIYFALGTFGEGENKRTAENVQMVKTFAVDVDCNHPKTSLTKMAISSPRRTPPPRQQHRPSWTSQSLLDCLRWVTHGWWHQAVVCTHTGRLAKPWTSTSGSQ
jgi:hypothetical protein